MLPGDPAAEGIAPPAGSDADSVTWIRSLTAPSEPCAEAMDLLHVYAELVTADVSAAERYPGIAAHLRACGPCGEDFDGLLAALRSTADSPAGSPKAPRNLRVANRRNQIGG